MPHAYWTIPITLITKIDTNDITSNLSFMSSDIVTPSVYVISMFYIT